MARKPKRMALYEAIRQGQAKIAKGLESGQMRSDSRVHKKVAAKPVHDDGGPLEEHPKSPGIAALSKTLAAVSGVAVLVVLLFGIWLGMHFANRPVSVTVPEDDSVAAITAAPGDVAAKTDDRGSGALGLGGRTQTQTVEAPKPVKPVAPTGANVIVIQQIPPDQQEKLVSVKEYYDAKGIPTELIQRSGYSLVVTKAGFDHNPNREGTEGYRLIQRIKQLGLAYPEETGDTKFGIRPFQDAYPLKR